MDFPEGKRYLSFAALLRQRYGQRLQKLVIDAGFTCPNRDGTVGLGGCTFCDSIAEQLDEGISFHKVRYPRAGRYLAYFQAYSNTYAPVSRLKELYLEALSHPEVCGIVIGTRPDCVDGRKLDMIAELAALPTGEDAPFDKPIVRIEYGIESCSDDTLGRINRGHDFECARRAVGMTAERGIPVGAHFILRLPGETRGTMLRQCADISSLPLDSVKFHQLQIIKGTRMEKEYSERPEDFLRLGLEDYLDFVVDLLERLRPDLARLRPDLAVERVAGEVPPRFVEETPWGLVRNFEILRMLDRRLEERDTFQGRLY